MRMSTFLKGVGVGVAVGAAVSMMSKPMRKKSMAKGNAHRALKAISEVMDNISDVIS